MTGAEFFDGICRQFEASRQDIRRQRVRAVVTAGLIILAFAGWLGIEAPKRILSGTDELLTAERTREMLITEPWVVHYNFERSLEKPRLQYWLTSLTPPRFQNRVVAVCVWPPLHGGLTAIALGWVDFLVKPDEPWLIALSVSSIGILSVHRWKRCAFFAVVMVQ